MLRLYAVHGVLERRFSVYEHIEVLVHPLKVRMTYHLAQASDKLEPPRRLKTTSAVDATMGASSSSLTPASRHARTMRHPRSFMLGLAARNARPGMRPGVRVAFAQARCSALVAAVVGVVCRRCKTTSG